MIAIRRSALPTAVSLPLAFLLVHGSARGAPPSAVISGTVSDSAGAPLAGAGGTLSGDGIAASRVTTDARGGYRFPAGQPRHVSSRTPARAGVPTITYGGVV